MINCLFVRRWWLWMATSALLASSCDWLAPLSPTPEQVEITLSPTTPINRQQVIDAYLAEFVPSGFVWNGNNSTCTAGTVPQSIHDRVKRRINYFRDMVGLPDVGIDATASQRAQQAALMMSANNDLSHFPPTSWKCYTEDGAYSARHANLCIGCVAEKSIDMYMYDDGANNISVGHRRWVLYSRALSFGHGSTDRGSALDWDTPTTSQSPEIEAIAYPPAGLISSRLVRTGGITAFRWSLGVPATATDWPDFSGSTVAMTDSLGQPVQATIIFRGESYGDLSLVWETPPAVTEVSRDVTYHIAVDSVVVGNETRNFRYDVTIVKH